MQANNTINPGAVDATDFEMADPLMQAMADTGFEGMTATSNVVCKMAEMLDAAVKRLDAIGAKAGKDTGALTTLASNHALMMRKHGTTLRGAKHAAMLEDLCDAILAAKRPIVVAEKKTEQQEPAVTAITLPPSGCITVEQAMEALGLKTLTHLAKILGVTSGSISGWRKQGFIHWKQSQVVAELTREAA